VSARSPSTFAILPAIDLRDGKVVRLRQGDFAREQVYADDPVAVARGFAAAGAEWIHCVDLDGARAGERRQTTTIAAIAEAFAELPADGPRLQVAGGLRSREAINEVLALGVERVVIGTAALRDPELIAAAIADHGPGRIAVALDVRDGLAIGEGWVSGATGVPVEEALAGLISLGVTTFAVTSIERDGLLGGPDLELLAACVGATRADANRADATVGATRVAILASGGIRSIADLEAVRAIGCAGAIVGRAIYDGSLDVADAVAMAGTPTTLSA
jgi:phosphoribosylformimino-5-aminoimidazole carboxamide ribotide isomerase